VLVCGLGGIGSFVAASLAAAGVGHLMLCDSDVVERSNLTRQYLYSLGDIGMRKTDALARRLSGVTPYVRIDGVHRTIGGPADLADLIPACDLVVSCADLPSITDMAEIITAACWPGTPHLLGGSYSYHLGILGLMVIPGVTACWHCLRREIMDEHGDPGMALIPRSRKAGVLGAQSGIVANLVAWEALRFLAGMPAALQDRWAEIDFWPLTISSRTISRHPDCPRCSHPMRSGGS